MADEHKWLNSYHVLLDRSYLKSECHVYILNSHKHLLSIKQSTVKQCLTAGCCWPSFAIFPGKSHQVGAPSAQQSMPSDHENLISNWFSGGFKKKPWITTDLCSSTWLLWINTCKKGHPSVLANSVSWTVAGTVVCISLSPAWYQDNSSNFGDVQGKFSRHWSQKEEVQGCS